MENKRVAVVTGASKGIGESFCRMLINEGYKVYGLCRSQPENSQINWVRCDLMDKQSIQSAAQSVLDSEERIDLLVNNAGMGISGAIEFATDKDIERQMGVNFNGAVYLTQMFLPSMRNRNHGRIVFTSSLASIFPIPYQGFYSASKSAINSFSDALSLEVRQFSVECCLLLLNDVRTAFTDNRIKNPQGDQLYNGRISASVGRMEKDERNGMSVDQISDHLRRLLKRRHLPNRSVVGLQGKLFNFLNHILPNSEVMKLLYRIYG